MICSLGYFGIESHLIEWILVCSNVNIVRNFRVRKKLDRSSCHKYKSDRKLLAVKRSWLSKVKWVYMYNIWEHMKHSTENILIAEIFSECILMTRRICHLELSESDQRNPPRKSCESQLILMVRLVERCLNSDMKRNCLWKAWEGFMKQSSKSTHSDEMKVHCCLDLTSFMWHWRCPQGRWPRMYITARQVICSVGYVTIQTIYKCMRLRIMLLF